MRTVSPLELSERVWPCQHLNFVLEPPELRQKISVALIHLVYDILLQILPGPPNSPTKCPQTCLPEQWAAEIFIPWPPPPFNWGLWMGALVSEHFRAVFSCWLGKLPRHQRKSEFVVGHFKLIQNYPLKLWIKSEMGQGYVMQDPTCECLMLLAKNPHAIQHTYPGNCLEFDVQF